MSALPAVPAQSSGTPAAATTTTASPDTTPPEVGGATAAAQLITAGAPTDFRALIASLTRVELPATETATAELPEATDQRLDSDAGETQPASDLQVAIAAMSMLPWPGVAAQPMPASNGSELIGAEPELTSAVATKLVPGPVIAGANAAAVLPQLIRKTDLPADSKQPVQPLVPTDAAPEQTALLGKITGNEKLRDADAALPERRHEDRSESRGHQAMAELRANFSAVMSETSISAKVERSVSVPVHDARWPAAVANEVRWCARAGIQSATLKLVPENLGPIELHVDLQDNKVNVNFTANQADTRNALEQSLPRLREMLAGSGLTLGQANVQQEARRESQFAAVTPRVGPGDLPATEVRTARIAIGLVDEYA
jgi:flagellar hook-length control protein FliK